MLLVMSRLRRKQLALVVAVVAVALVVGGILMTRRSVGPLQADVDARARVLTASDGQAACAAAATIHDPLIRTSAVFAWIGAQRGTIATVDTRCMCALVHTSEVASCDRRASAAHLRR